MTTRRELLLKPLTRDSTRMAIAMLAVTLAMLSTGAEAARKASGVAGKVLLSPTCAGPLRPDRVCEGPHAGARIQLVDKRGAVRAEAVTDAEGAFRLGAAPGSYELRVVVEGRYPRCEAVAVKIRGGRYTTVSIQCDTGMR